MTEDETRFYQALMQNLNNSIQYMKVAEEGLAQERTMLEIHEAQLESIKHALNFLRSSDCRIISMHELRLLKRDVHRARSLVHRSNGIVLSLTNLVQDHDREARITRRKMEHFLLQTERGKILEFKRKTDER